MAIAPVPKTLRDAIDECVGRFGDTLSTILWFGSTARGEGNAESDEDLVLIFRAVDSDVLSTVRTIFATEERADWSIDVRSDTEMRQLPYDLSYLRFVFGFRVLHGDFQAFPLPREALLGALRHLASQTSRTCRHRYLVGRHSGKHVHGMAKRAVLAMKKRHYLLHSHWPATAAELTRYVEHPDERSIIDWVARWPEARPYFKRDPASALLLIDAFMRRLIELLPEPENPASPGA